MQFCSLISESDIQQQNGPVREYVCVSCQGSETTIFPCECWLAKSENDGETVRELVPSDIITEKLLRDGKLKKTETEVEDALESRFTLISLVECHKALLLTYYTILQTSPM